MKIALISPAGVMYGKKGIFPRALRYAPLTLTTLASLIPEELNAEVEIIDEGIKDAPKKTDADIIGISAITGTVNRSYFLADYFRKQGKIVILGGVHPSIMPKEAKKHADSVVIGMSYKTWPKLLKDYKEGKLKSFYHDKDPSVNNLPIPRRELIGKFSYITRNSMQAVFGCPNECDFCVVHATQKGYFHRPINDVIKELNTLNSSFITFVDPSPIEDKEYAKELFKKMIPLKKKWGGLATVNIAYDDELLDLAAKSGCKGLLIGFESINQGSNKEFHKEQNKVDEYKYVIKRLHDKGIAINGTFMFGMDTDTKNVFKRTVDFVNETGIELPRYSVYTPFPETQTFERLKKQGRLTETDWSLYDAQHVVFKPKNMNAEELREGTLWAWEQTYSFKSIFKRLSKSKSNKILTLITNLGYRYYAKRLRRYTNERVLKIEEERNRC